MTTIHIIQWQKCNCCPPLRLVLPCPAMFNGQKMVLDITENSSQSVSLSHRFKLYNNFAVPQLDKLIEYMSSRVTKTPLVSGFC